MERSSSLLSTYLTTMEDEMLLEEGRGSKGWGDHGRLSVDEVIKNHVK